MSLTKIPVGEIVKMVDRSFMGNLEDPHPAEVLIGNGGENMDQDGKDHSQGGHHKETWR